MKHTCHAAGCETEVPPRMLMCGKHWRMVPRAIQLRVWQHYRSGQEIDKKPSAEYLEVMREATQAVKAKEGVR